MMNLDGILERTWDLEHKTALFKTKNSRST
jgi:hypothetical protein